MGAVYDLFFAVDQQSAAVDRLRAEDRTDNRLALATQESGYPQDLSLSQSEGDILESLALTDALGFQNDGAELSVSIATLPGFVLTPNHQRDKARNVETACSFRRDDPAVAKDGHPVRNRQDLAQPVRDIDDTQAARLQAHDDLEQVLDLVIVQRGRGLIEDDDLRVRRQGTTDFDDLLLVEAKRPEQADWDRSRP